MKDIVNFYAAIFFPIILIASLAKNGAVDSTIFCFLLLIYCLVYRPLISGLRLLGLGVIKKSEIFKPFIPFWSMKYYSLIYFNKM
jgi:hypothetical protein